MRLVHCHRAIACPAAAVTAPASKIRICVGFCRQANHRTLDIILLAIRPTANTGQAGGHRSATGA